MARANCTQTLQVLDDLDSFASKFDYLSSEMSLGGICGQLEDELAALSQRGITSLKVLYDLATRSLLQATLRRSSTWLIRAALKWKLDLTPPKSALA